jgi:hypothetical protein
MTVRMSFRRRLRNVQQNFDGDEDETAETLRVRCWRYEQLVEAGYSAEEASEIARDPAVDLERARKLVQRLGCPPHLAMRILV